MTLANSAMLASVRITGWTARKLDRGVTDKANAQHNAATDAGRYNKHLLGGDCLREIQRIAGEARDGLYQRTLPWSDAGARVLTATGYLDFTKWFRTIQARYLDAVDRAATAYPDFLALEPSRLGAMYNPDDYPTPGEFRRRFSISCAIDPLPTSGDFRVTASGLSDADRAAIQADIEKRSAERIAEAMRDVYQRIVERVGHMATKLAEYVPAEANGGKSAGIFRDSLVENVRELAAVLPALNLTGDPMLSRLSAQIENELCFFDASDLRDDAKQRKLVADTAARIARDAAEFLA